MFRLRAPLIPALLAAVLAAGCTSIVTPDYGPREGHLPPCPANLDCASSQDTDPKLYIAPFPIAFITGDLQGTRDKAHSDLVGAVNAAGQARVVSNRRNYVRVEYPAPGEALKKSDYYYQPDEAVDEIQFYLPPDSRVIEIYSVGKLGVLDNSDARARVEKIRTVFMQLQLKPPK